jgi:formylmethanofuran dehydrogenase subunit E-like metal-binding protein
MNLTSEFFRIAHRTVVSKQFAPAIPIVHGDRVTQIGRGIVKSISDVSAIIDDTMDMCNKDDFELNYLHQVELNVMQFLQKCAADMAELETLIENQSKLRERRKNMFLIAHNKSLIAILYMKFNELTKASNEFTAFVKRYYQNSFQGNRTRDNSNRIENENEKNEASEVTTSQSITSSSSSSITGSRVQEQLQIQVEPINATSFDASKLEQCMEEVSSMISLVSTKLVEQSEDVQLILEESIAARAFVQQGNQELTKAISRPSLLRDFSIIILAVLSLALAFLEYYSR